MAHPRCPGADPDAAQLSASPAAAAATPGRKPRRPPPPPGSSTLAPPDFFRQSHAATMRGCWRAHAPRNDSFRLCCDAGSRTQVVSTLAERTPARGVMSIWMTAMPPSSLARSPSIMRRCSACAIGLRLLRSPYSVVRSRRSAVYSGILLASTMISMTPRRRSSADRLVVGQQREHAATGPSSTARRRRSASCPPCASTLGSANRLLSGRVSSSTSGKPNGKFADARTALGSDGSNRGNSLSRP